MHRNADLDALASAYYLSEIHQNCSIVSDGLDRFSKIIVRELDVNVLDDIPEKPEKIMVVDTASREQLGKFRDVKIDAVFDHHRSNDIQSPERFVMPEYASCSEMLYDIMGKKVSKKAYILLLGGIISDTRWFKNANTKTFEIFVRIIRDGGIDYEEIKKLFQFNLNFGEKISLLKGFQRLKYRTKGDKIICATKIGANESVVANALINIVDLIFVASQRGEEVRIVARSKSDNLLDIFSILSRDFSCSYGGHVNAAGAMCVGDAEAILDILLQIAGK